MATRLHILRSALMALLLPTLAACTAILDAGAEQCAVAEDCAFLGPDYACSNRVCVTDQDVGGCAPVERYTVEPTIAVIRNACELPSLRARVMTDGTNEVEVGSPLDEPLPFDVCIYGQQADDFWIGDNGYLAFGAEPPNALQSSVGAAHSLGEPGVPGPGIAAFWDALRPSERGACVAVDGTAPTRTLWITWESSCFEDATGRCDAEAGSDLTFSVGVEEGTGIFTAGYLTMQAQGALADRARAQTATIGITNDGDRGCPASECDDTGSCMDGSPCNYTEFSSQAVLSSLPALQFVPN